MAFMGLEPTTDCLIPLIETVEVQAKGDLAGLDETAMNWRPPGGGWSVAQVLEHLVISNTLYFDPVSRLIQRAERETGPIPPWKPSLMGRLLIRAVLPTTERKMTTVKKLEPGPEPGANVTERFLHTLHRISALLRHAQGIDMRKPRLTSPVSAMVRRLNLGDAFVVLVAHTQRHMRQIEHVIAAPGFPSRESTAG